MTQIRYILIDEDTDECDWEGSIGNENNEACDLQGVFGLIDTQDNTDPEYPEGFHMGHYCATHGAIVLRKVNESPL